MLQPIWINLASAPRRGMRSGRVLLLAVGVAAIVLTSANLIHAWRQQHDIRDYSARIAALGARASSSNPQQKSAEVKAGAEAMQQAQRELLFVKRLEAADRFPWNPILEELERRLPDEVTLQEVTPAEKGQRLVFKGRAVDPQQVAELLRNLSASDILQAPELSRLAIDPSAAAAGAAAKGKPAVSFEARCTLALDRLAAALRAPAPAGGHNT